MRPFVAALLCLGIATCTTLTVDHAAARPAAAGYSEVRIAPGRYRITLQGGYGATVDQVEDYIMLRAAQVTLRDGYDWFAVVDRVGEAPQPAGSADNGSGAAGGMEPERVSPHSRGRITRSLEIDCGKGPRPLGGNTYDAAGVLAALITPQGPSQPR